LEQLYDRRTEQQFDDLYVHASPRDPVMEYVEETDCVDMGFGPSEKIMQIMSFVKKICFVGHSHRPGIVTADYKWIHPHELPEADETGNGGIYEIPEGSRALVNIGSLGQPRDEDPRSCIVTYDLKRTVQFHRVPYDVDAMVEGVKNVPQLDIRLGERLRLGR
jgi:diadenosine tetraphosphatase ApaH/serine/threonine PP2A family protein phosphatase